MSITRCYALLLFLLSCFPLGAQDFAYQLDWKKDALLLGGAGGRMPLVRSGTYRYSGKRNSGLLPPYPSPAGCACCSSGSRLNR